MAEKQDQAEELKRNPGKFGLGYDEDGVSVAPWPLGAGGVRLCRIQEMIAKLENPKFRITKKTPNYANPYLYSDGCCYNELATKEKAVEYWQGRLIDRQEEIEREKKQCIN